jgi:carbon-monoxide dehydrogenase medium subunit
VKRAADWAIVGAAVVRDGGHTGVALVNMAPVPLRATAVEAALAAGASTAEAAERAADDADPSADIHASVEYRRHLARVLVRRGLDEAAGRST